MQRIGVSRITLQKQNEGATMPLIMPVQLIANAPKPSIDENTRINARNKSLEVVKYCEPHDGVAILVGSGPSLADTIDGIATYQHTGAKVFALNNAANYLYGKGITADYQVVVDSRPRTLELLGPAKDYLFASQVDPRAFERHPTAKMYHMAVDNIDDLLPVPYQTCALIGGGTSVGCCALALVWALGYRTIHCYGYDSSARITSEGGSFQRHALFQAMNDGEVMCEVKFDGKPYKTSLTMAYQADRFMEMAALLQTHADAKIFVHGDGYLPDRFNASPEAIEEAEKYRRMWEHEAYRVTSHGENCIPTFLEVAKPAPGSTIVDFGCGTGRAGVALQKMGFRVGNIDIADNCRDPEALHVEFRVHDMREPMDWFKVDYGLCTDVMEHIPTDNVDAVIKNITDCAGVTFFQINTMFDKFGELIDQPLHLTVKLQPWWKQKMLDLGLEIMWEDHDVIACQFLVRRKHD